MRQQRHTSEPEKLLIFLDLIALIRMFLVLNNPGVILDTLAKTWIVHPGGCSSSSSSFAAAAVGHLRKGYEFRALLGPWNS
jgi:hypothetical protein